MGKKLEKVNWSQIIREHELIAFHIMVISYRKK